MLPDKAIDAPRDRLVNLLCRSVIAVVLALPVWLGISHGVLDFERNQGLEAALIGAAVIHLWTRPKWTEWLPALVIGALASAAYGLKHHGFGPYLDSTFGACGAFLGAGSLAVLAVALCLSDSDRRPRLRRTLIAAAVFPYFSFILTFGLNLTTALRPRVYDLVLYSFDESLQLRAGAWIGHFFAVSMPLRVAGIFVYEYLPVAICLLLALQRARPTRFSVDPLRLFIAVGVVGAVLYNTLPACGPIYIFGAKFPDNLPSISDLTVQPVLLAGKPRNAMPSLHFACALLILWNTVGLARRWRVGAAAFLAMTFFSTIGFGEHYLIDLIVAVPFAVAMQAACMHSASWDCWERRVACFGGAALTLAWISALRGGLFPAGAAAIAWCAVLATLALSLWWKRGLDLDGDFEQQIVSVRSVILPQEP